MLNRLHSLQIFPSLHSEDVDASASPVTDRKFRWWSAVIMCAHAWTDRGAAASEEAKYYHIVSALPEELELNPLAKSISYAFRVSSASGGGG